MKPIFFAALILFAALGSSCCIMRESVAEEVSGRVVDAETGEPIPNVSIYRSLGRDLTLLSKSDPNGEFYVEGLMMIRMEIPRDGSSLVFKKEGYLDSSLKDGAVVSPPVSGVKEVIRLKKEPNKPNKRTTDNSGAD